ncbi:hypothetical protein PR048_011440 [Dryococelus australis]|uniref:Reverse transcriptase domain-containing protein n=1 Tax=Dryococelus australis TaxID=614101 RepID=A0ABQ9HLM0_9NEOP|nr:hypothetical protein PR048_011440 [Dryococelus australis]
MIHCIRNVNQFEINAHRKLGMPKLNTVVNWVGNNHHVLCVTTCITVHSTFTALINIIEDVRSCVDSRQLTLLTLIDFSKAFDFVDYDILVAKLRS